MAILFVRSENLEKSWPFVPEPLQERLNELDEVRVINVERGQPIGEATDLSNVSAMVMFSGKLTEACMESASELKVLCGVWGGGHGMISGAIDALFEQDVTIIDGTRGWATSVAEITLALTLNALRMIPQWHKRMAAGERLWQFEYGQFCDNPDFVNGTLGSKTVGVMGLGRIGGLMAQWCNALGSRVIGYDPFISKERLDELGVEGVEMDTLVDEAEVVVMTIPPTPSAEKILSRERIYRLRKGALVVITTRAFAVDMEALRERILNNELAGAFDVYDKEPVPEDDPLRNRDNVVHTPHIAGRTRDANLSVVDVFAGEIGRVLQGEDPVVKVSRDAVAVRNEEMDLPAMKS